MKHRHNRSNCAFEPRIKRDCSSRERRGTVTVEMAVVSPIIFLIFFGSIELLNLNNIRNMANDAAFQAARRAVVPGASLSGAETNAEANLKLIGIDDPTVTITETTSGVVKATCEIELDKNSWGLSRFTKGLKITRSVEFTRERTE